MKNSNSNKTKELSILLHQSGFSFCVLNHGEIIHLEDLPLDTTHLEEDLQSIFENNLYLKQAYDKVVAGYLTHHFNLVPNEYINELKPEDFLGFNSAVLTQDQVEKNTVAEHDLTIVYTKQPLFEQLLKKQYSKFTLKNASAVFLENIKNVSDETQIFVNTHANQLEIAAFDSGKLKLYNIFPYETKEDFVYYVLFCLKQLNFDPNTAQLYYFGVLHQKENILRMLFNFVRHVMPGNSDEQFLENYTLLQQLQ